MHALIVLAALAAPGDKAAAQSKYPSIQTGATKLAEAQAALKKAGTVYKEHRAAAMAYLTEAQSELDLAVVYADKHPKKGEKATAHLDLDLGKLALGLKKHPGIVDGAKATIAAGKALDAGTTHFGGHRHDAIKKINAALAELDKAAKAAK